LDDSRHLLDTLPCGYIIFDDRGEIHYANKTLLDMVGRLEIEGTGIEELLTVPSRIFYQTHLFPLLAMKGVVSEIFLTLQASDGSRVPVMLNGKREDTGNGMRSICTVSTVWERQKYEKELIASRQQYQKAHEDNQVLKELTARLQDQQQELDRKIVELSRRKQEYLQLGKVLMHDMQEPIRKIGFYFDKVLSGFSQQAGSTSDQMLVKISKSVARLRQLINSAQRFVASEDEGGPVTLLSTEKLIRDAADEFITLTGIDDFELQIEGSVSFEGRGPVFTTLIFELISNAVRFRKKDMPLIISVRSLIVQENSFLLTADKYHYTDHVQIEFGDNGVGFEQRFATYIFGLFNKLESDGDGVGLGLALCEQIVSRHHGKISARSAVGSGSKFTIVLPVVQPKQPV
jgi:phosphoserine phosphatase RsbU/P